MLVWITYPTPDIDHWEYCCLNIEQDKTMYVSRQEYMYMFDSSIPCIPGHTIESRMMMTTTTSIHRHHEEWNNLTLSSLSALIRKITRQNLEGIPDCMKPHDMEQVHIQVEYRFHLESSMMEQRHNRKHRKHESHSIPIRSRVEEMPGTPNE